MAITEALRLLITADTAGAVRGIENVGRAADRNLSRSEKQLDRWGNRLTKVGTGLIAFGAVAAYGLGQAAKSASDLGEAVNASNVVFGDAVGTIDQYAKDAATSFGLSETAFRTATTQMGAQLKNLGFSTDQAAQSSVDLTERAADMASVFNTDVTEATQAIGAALRGERDPIERFGVTINEAAVRAKAMELGLAGATGELSLNAKAQASLALIMEQTNDIAGDFANTSDSMANKQRIVSAQFENLKASIGQAALPVLEDLLGVAQGGIKIFSGLNESTGGFVGKAATIGTIASLGVGGLSLLVGQALKMRQTFKEARDVISGLTGKLGGLKSAAGIAAGIAGVAGLALAVENMSRAADQARVERLTRDFLATGDAAELTAGLMSRSLDGVKDFAAALADLAQTDRERAQQLLNAAEAAGLDADMVELLRGQIELTAEAQDRAASATGEATGEVQGQAGAMSDAAGATGNATSALEEYNDALNAMFDPLFGMLDALDGQREAQVKLTEAQDALSTAVRDHGADSEEAAAAQRDYDSALRDAGGALVDVEGAQTELNKAVEDGDVSLDAAKDALYRWAINAGFTEAQARALAGQLDDATGAAQRLDRENPRVDVSTNAGSVARTIQSYIDGIRGRQVFVNVVETRFGTQRVGRFHEGGIIPGPRGQEVAAILQAGERVLSLQEVDAMNRRVPALAGGGAVYNDYRTFSITTGADPQAVVTALRRAGDLGIPVTLRGRSL